MYQNGLRKQIIHGYLHPGNIIFSNQAMLIDWDYGGLGHPHLDCAYLFESSSFSENVETNILSILQPIDKAVFNDLRALACLMWIHTFHHQNLETKEKIRYYQRANELIKKR